MPEQKWVFRKQSTSNCSALETNRFWLEITSKNLQSKKKNSARSLCFYYNISFLGKKDHAAVISAAHEAFTADNRVFLWPSVKNQDSRIAVTDPSQATRLFAVLHSWPSVSQVVSHTVCGLSFPVIRAGRSPSLMEMVQSALVPGREGVMADNDNRDYWLKSE